MNEERREQEFSERELFMKTRPLQMRKSAVMRELSMGETKLDEFKRKGELLSYRIHSMVLFNSGDVFDFVMKYRGPQTNNDLGLAI